MTEAPNNDFKSINFPSLVPRKYFRTRGQNHQLGWRHRRRQKIRAEFTLKELLELQKRFHLHDINSIINRQAIFLDKTNFGNKNTTHENSRLLLQVGDLTYLVI